jgi:hypothetical protein
VLRQAHLRFDLPEPKSVMIAKASVKAKATVCTVTPGVRSPARIQCRARSGAHPTTMANIDHRARANEATAANAVRLRPIAKSVA